MEGSRGYIRGGELRLYPWKGAEATFVEGSWGYIRGGELRLHSWKGARGYTLKSNGRISRLLQPFILSTTATEKEEEKLGKLTFTFFSHSPRPHMSRKLAHPTRRRHTRLWEPITAHKCGQAYFYLRAPPPFDPIFKCLVQFFFPFSLPSPTLAILSGLRNRVYAAVIFFFFGFNDQKVSLRHHGIIHRRPRRQHRHFAATLRGVPLIIRRNSLLFIVFLRGKAEETIEGVVSRKCASREFK